MSENKNKQKSWWSKHAWIVAILLTIIVIVTLVCLKCCNPVDNGGDGNSQIGDNNGAGEDTGNGDNNGAEEDPGNNEGIGDDSDNDDDTPTPHTHVWGEYVVTTPATCLNEGVLTAICTCGATTTKTVPAYDHAWGEWTDNGDDRHVRICANNSEHVEYEACRPDDDRPDYCEICDAFLCKHPVEYIGIEHDEDGHWYICSICGIAQSEKEEHYDDAVNKPCYCVVCDALFCKHPDYWVFMEYDASGHWLFCECCFNKLAEPLPHEYEEVSREEYCEEEGTVKYACVCGDSYSETIQPVGHDWGPWVAQADRTSLRTCKNDPTHTETMKVLAGNSVFVTTSTDMVFTVYQDVYEAYPGIYLEVSKPIYDANGNEISREVEIISDVYKVEGSKVRFLYRNLVAKEMSVVVNVKVFSGEDEYLAEFDYSIRTYAENMLRKDQPMELKTLLVDMLNYGTAAQKHFKYMTDDLANKNLTEEELSWGTQEIPEMRNDEVLTRSEEENSITLHGNAISLENSVKLNVHFELGKYSLEDINIVYTYLNDSGDEKRRVVVDGTEATAIDTGYRYVFDNAGYSGVRSMVRISFEDKATGEQIGDSVVCSVESYLAQKYEESTDEDFRELLILIMKYGDSASAYAKYVGM